MKLPQRRQFLHLAAGAAALSALPRIARAQAYPNRPVHLIVPAPAGGPADIVGRIIAQWLTERLGQSVVVENRGTAGGNVATESVARATPDGYTLLSSTVTTAINQTLYEKLNFNFITDLMPVGNLVSTPGTLVVKPSFPAKSVPELIAYAKANPGKIDQASGGTGSIAHMWGELFKLMAGVNMTHVPYRGGGPALSDLLAGVVDLSFLPMPVSIEHIKSGRLRALGVTTAKPVAALPDLPPIGDFVRGYEGDGWQGVSAPKGTPAAIVDRLNLEINAGLADTKVRTRFEELGANVIPGTAAQFGKFCADEVAKWARVIKSAGIKAE